MKKIIAAMLAVLLLNLCACADNVQPTETAPTAPETEAATPYPQVMYKGDLYEIKSTEETTCLAYWDHENYPTTYATIIDPEQTPTHDNECNLPAKEIVIVDDITGDWDKIIVDADGKQLFATKVTN